MKCSNFPREGSNAPHAEHRSDDEDGFLDEEVPLHPFEDIGEDEGAVGDATNVDFELRLPTLPLDAEKDTAITFDMASLLNETSQLESTSDDLLPSETDVGLLLSGLDAEVTLNERELATETLIEDFSLPSFEATDDGALALQFQDIAIDDRFTLITEESSLWHEEQLSHDKSFTAVDCSKVAWVSGGPDLVWLAELGHNQIRCSVEGGNIAQLALCHDTAVYLTDRGFLGRRHARASQPELLGRPPGSNGGSSVKLGKYPNAGAEHLWLLSDGTMWLSQDLGTTWLPQQREPKALDVCSSGLGLTGLGWLDGALQVFTWMPDAPESHGVLVNPEDAKRFTRTRAPKLEALLNLVVVWDTELGVFVSCDGARSFTLCRGLQTPTAAVVGLLDDRPAVWVACHDSGIDESLIWQITPELTSGKCIARIQDTNAPSVDSNGEFLRNRVRGLAWDEALTRLLAVGSFGVSAFSRPA